MNNEILDNIDVDNMIDAVMDNYKYGFNIILSSNEVYYRHRDNSDSDKPLTRFSFDLLYDSDVRYVINRLDLNKKDETELRSINRTLDNHYNTENNKLLKCNLSDDKKYIINPFDKSLVINKELIRIYDEDNNLLIDGLDKKFNIDNIDSLYIDMSSDVNDNGDIERSINIYDLDKINNIIDRYNKVSTGFDSFEYMKYIVIYVILGIIGIIILSILNILIKLQLIPILMVYLVILFILLLIHKSYNNGIINNVLELLNSKQYNKRKEIEFKY